MLFATLITALAPACFPGADYSPLEEAEMIISADLAVEATIVDERDTTLSLEIHAVLFGRRPNGRLPGKVLEVTGFEDWTCAGRHVSYAKGQRAVFFLSFERSREGVIEKVAPPSVMGAANAGECPIAKGVVFHKGVGVRGLPRAEQVHGARYFGNATPRDEFVEAVRGLRGCFRWDRSQGSAWFARPEHIVRTCNPTELEEYIASSKLAASLVRDSRILAEAR